MHNENNKYGERIAMVEVISGENKKDIEGLQKDNTMLHRLVVTQETLTELVKDNQQQMREFSDTLTNVNANLTHLNVSQAEMRADLNGFENELKSVKENHVKIENKGKFDMLAFLSGDLIKLILTSIVLAILAYIGLK